MTIPTTETLPRTEGLRRDEMKEPDDVSAMLRLKSLGWGARRIAAELGCLRTTARRWLKEGAWGKPAAPLRPNRNRVELKVGQFFMSPPGQFRMSLDTSYALQRIPVALPVP